jgi:hypothetical protein
MGVARRPGGQLERFLNTAEEIGNEEKPAAYFSQRSGKF